VTRLVRASEIGAFTFCERAWGYAARGEASQREPDLEAGQHDHQRRLRRAALSGSMFRLGLACLLLAAGALAVALTT
jgi:hypothetical protein